VREVWKHWVPPYALFGPDAAAAELAAGAQAQGRFWELHDAVFAQAGKRLSRPELEALARSVGVDLERLRKESMAGQLRGALERDQSEARKLGLGYGPALLLNGILVAASSDIRLEALAREELARGLFERLKSSP
jgi:protein-disulfide isomerase